VRMGLRYYSGSAPQTEFEAQTSGAFDRITRRRGDGNPMKAIAGLCAASVLSLLLHALHSGSSPSALPDPRRTPGAVDARIRLHRSSPQRFRGRQHLIPLEIGGAPANPRNLWPEPHVAPGGWGSRRKDFLENRLCQLVCEGRVPLAEAQRAIARNWIDAYRKYAAGGP
jgi:hypothetical protein